MAFLSLHIFFAVMCPVYMTNVDFCSSSLWTHFSSYLLSRALSFCGGFMGTEQWVSLLTGSVPTGFHQCSAPAEYQQKGKSEAGVVIPLVPCLQSYPGLATYLNLRSQALSGGPLLTASLVSWLHRSGDNGHPSLQALDTALPLYLPYSAHSVANSLLSFPLVTQEPSASARTVTNISGCPQFI